MSAFNPADTAQGSGQARLPPADAGYTDRRASVGGRSGRGGIYGREQERGLQKKLHAEVPW